MSAGHHTHPEHSDAQKRELKRLLADSRVKKLLATPYRVNLSHEMPLTGGSTVEWGTFFLDPKLKKHFAVGNRADQDLAPFVLRHEVVEKALRKVFGMSYDRAHLFATMAEMDEVEKSRLNWEAYKRVMMSLDRKDERERPKSLPKGYDYGPLRASRGLKSLKGLRERA